VGMTAQKTRQASAHGIEVTPEMIEAGAQVIYSRPSLCEDGWGELAVEVYEAMEMARLLAAAGHSGIAQARGLPQSTHRDR
jgi:hypothetical protein